jgi:hypothetical protein
MGGTPTEQRLTYGRSRWKPMAGRRSRHQRSRNASTAAMAGYKSNAIAARPRPASLVSGPHIMCCARYFVLQPIVELVRLTERARD